MSKPLQTPGEKAYMQAMVRDTASRGGGPLWLSWVDLSDKARENWEEVADRQREAEVASRFNDTFVVPVQVRRFMERKHEPLGELHLTAFQLKTLIMAFYRGRKAYFEDVPADAALVMDESSSASVLNLVLSLEPPRTENRDVMVAVLNLVAGEGAPDVGPRFLPGPFGMIPMPSHFPRPAYALIFLPPKDVAVKWRWGGPGEQYSRSFDTRRQADDWMWTRVREGKAREGDAKLEVVFMVQPKEEPVPEKGEPEAVAAPEKDEPEAGHGSSRFRAHFKMRAEGGKGKEMLLVKEIFGSGVQIAPVPDDPQHLLVTIRFHDVVPKPLVEACKAGMFAAVLALEPWTVESDAAVYEDDNHKQVKFMAVKGKTRGRSKSE